MDDDCLESRSEPARMRRGPAATLGAATKDRGERKVVFVLDPDGRRIYVDRAAHDSLIRGLGARHLGGKEWEIPWCGELEKFHELPLGELDRFARWRGHVIGISKSKCVLYKEGRCINMIDEDGTPSGSFKAPKEFYGCGTGDEICKEIEQTLELDVYPEPNCKGTPKKQSITLDLCTPA